MPPVETWDETKPAGTRDLSLGDDDIREFKRALTERLRLGGMYYPTTDDALAGEHSYLRLAKQSSKPTAVTNKGFLYTKQVGGYDEPFFERGNGDEAQLDPVGSIVAYGGTSAPTGWLLCDGTAVSRTTYAALFAIISTAFGTGDGVTTFNLPDLRGRFPIGKAASGTGSTLGGTGGAIDHTHTGPSHTHTGPSHTHAGTTNDPTFTVNNPGINTGGASPTHQHAFTTGAAGTGATGSDGTGATGTGNPPFQAVNYLIKS